MFICLKERFSGELEVEEIEQGYGGVGRVIEVKRLGERDLVQVEYSFGWKEYIFFEKGRNVKIYIGIGMDREKMKFGLKVLVFFEVRFKVDY